MTMFRGDKEIETIARGLIQKTWPKKAWTHRAHIATAVWLFNSPDYNPYHDMPHMIRTYNESVGTENSDTNGYHETITIASLKAVDSFLKKASFNTPLFKTANRLMSSQYGNSNWLLSYWSKNNLFSPKARKEWVDPDLIALPF